VFIHPKILDGDGETMSKTKGNGVDPFDVIEKFGADALRFAICYLTTETQDVRLPVEFECPSCQAHVKQTRNNRVLPRVKCPKCGRPFSTQWAETEADQALPRAGVVSERFELARNFCNKLWNASRFALLNLEGYRPGQVTADELEVEDRWILSRLATITDQVTSALDAFRFADAARLLVEFAWDEFCSFYVEMIKARLQDDNRRTVAQRVLAGALDVLLRLLHPMIPFLTEEVWQRLAEVAPERGLDRHPPATDSVMIATWPDSRPDRRDAETEQRFSLFQSVLGGVREIRSRQNIPPRTSLQFSVRCPSEVADQLAPMTAYFQAMAVATAVAWGPDVEPFVHSGNTSLPGLEVYVDLEDFLDMDAELARKTKEQVKLDTLIAGKEKKLANAQFISRAPADVVARERDGLAELQRQRTSVESAIHELRKQV